MLLYDSIGTVCKDTFLYLLCSSKVAGVQQFKLIAPQVVVNTHGFVRKISK